MRHHLAAGAFALALIAASPLTAGAAEIRDVVIAAALRHAVPVRLALGVAAVESGFSPRARSGAGALGLMQIMPATARGLGCRGSLLSAAVNADCGARYLARLLRRCGGDLRRAAALYTVGEFGDPRRGRDYAARVMRRPGGTP